MMSDDLADLLDDMAGDHLGIDCIRYGIALLLEKPLAPKATALGMHDLAGAAGRDLVTAMVLAARDLAAPHADRVQDREQYLLDLKHATDAALEFDGRQNVIDVIAALDTTGGRCNAMDQELRDKVKKLNKESEQRPR